MIAPLSVWWFLWFGVGLIGPLLAIPYITLLQAESPSNMVARFTAVAHALQNSAMLVSPMVGAGAFLAHEIGVEGVFIIAGAAFVIIFTLDSTLP
ncbi:hypothetical protein [Paludifilum halophilum]|uniref:Major facilitator superfamily (MFS) profile domain-containing protein n=1 Tax=Paludifilum halophilum TaxID=1642702 RepID=A0A235B579_9BACL|nr:hypothetical protein [Paludifilum halophilum]OYD07119.1 hypothetical protein CHM34_12025 [Paludifilum halophilum]